MGELIDVVLGNPFLLLLIIGGLISLFRKKGEETNSETPEQTQQQQRQQTSQQPEERKPSRFEDFLGKLEEGLSDKGHEETVKPAPEEVPEQRKVSAHDRRMEQMQQISDQIESGTYNEAEQVEDYFSENTLQRGLPEEKLNELERQLRNDVKKRLSKKSLIDSIIMAEVLGEPRSRKPYQNRNMNRQSIY